MNAMLKSFEADRLLKRLSDLFWAWITLIVVWVLELLVYVLGLLRIQGDHYYPEEIVTVGLIGGPIFSAVALVVLVIPLTLFARFVVRRLRCHRAIPYMVFLGASGLLAALEGLCELELGVKKPFDIGVFGCRVVYVLAGCSVLWIISRRHEQAA